MRARLTRLGAALAALAALAVGGSALASANSKGSTPQPATTTQAQQDQGANVQQGDQSAPDTGQTAENAPESATENASEAAGENASEAAGESAQSESAQSDGPGGYADTNPNADTQQTGEH